MNVRQLLDLGGRVALVTGGSRGLGLQIAEALGEMGAKVAITARKKNELDEAVAHLQKLKIDATAYVCDMGKREAIAPCADEVLKKFGKVDILVNNAGATWGAPATRSSGKGWPGRTACRRPAGGRVTGPRHPPNDRERPVPRDRSESCCGRETGRRKVC
jgi:gluconate 5-dehydrogenase